MKLGLADHLYDANLVLHTKIMQNLRNSNKLSLSYDKQAGLLLCVITHIVSVHVPFSLSNRPDLSDQALI